MSKETLPAVAEPAQAPAIYQAPTSFEVVDRGNATVVRFEHLGDSFVGRFEYSVEMDQTRKDGEIERFTQAHFTGADGQAYCIFPGASLERALRRINGGDWVRITYDRDVEIGKPSPLKNYIVERGVA